MDLLNIEWIWGFSMFLFLSFSEDKMDMFLIELNKLKKNGESAEDLSRSIHSNFYNFMFIYHYLLTK